MTEIKETTVVNINAVNYTKDDNQMIYIGRPGKGQPGTFRNPTPDDGDLTKCLREYRGYILHSKQTALRQLAREQCRGKRLVCFCKPRGCHGDLLAVVADSKDDESLNKTLYDIDRGADQKIKDAQTKLKQTILSFGSTKTNSNPALLCACGKAKLIWQAECRQCL